MRCLTFYNRSYFPYEGQNGYRSMEKQAFRVMVFNTTFTKILVMSWRSVLLVKESGVPREHHRPVANH